MAAADQKVFNSSLGSATPGTVACQVLSAASVASASIVASGTVSAAAFTGGWTRSGVATIPGGGAALSVVVQVPGLTANGVVLCQYLGAAVDGTLTRITNVTVAPGQFTIVGDANATDPVLVAWAVMKL